MAAVSTLQALYIEELRDLCSANDQMLAIVETMVPKVFDEKLKGLLQRSVGAIAEHTSAVRAMLPSHVELQCRGMQGLVEEASRHAFDDDLPARLRDIAIVAQYQRMSHYGIAGFGTAAAYAAALGRTDQVNTLRAIVSDIYRGDEFASAMAENLEKAAADRDNGTDRPDA
jgi:ferritin-like metal-binding protein YciE